MTSKVLLDTCAVIWIASGDSIAQPAERAFVSACLADGAYVSPATAWEIGLLSRPRPNKPPLVFAPDPLTWIRLFLARPGVKSTDLSPDIAIESSRLPEPFHSDPADRFIVATARALNAPIITRDAKIIAYAQAGHVSAIPC